MALKRGSAIRTQKYAFLQTTEECSLGFLKNNKKIQESREEQAQEGHHKGIWNRGAESTETETKLQGAEYLDTGAPGPAARERLPEHLGLEESIARCPGVQDRISPGGG